MNLEDEWTQKIERGERLSTEDLIGLYEHEDLFFLGDLANKVQKKLGGSKVSYNLVYAFGLPEIFFLQSDQSASPSKDFFLEEKSLSEHFLSLEKALEHGVTEVYLGREVFPNKNFDFYLETFRKLKSSFPALFIRAFNAIDISFFSEKTGLSFEAIFQDLKESGLDGLADLNTQIFSAHKKRLITPTFELNDFLLIHEAAHKLGITSSISMPYTYKGPQSVTIGFLEAIRSLQDKTKGVTSLTPYPTNFSILPCSVKGAYSAAEDLRFMALSRLFLDNIQSIRANWTIYGPDLSQIATFFGAGDIGSVWIGESGDEDFFVTRQRVRDLIFRARKTPMQLRSGSFLPEEEEVEEKESLHEPLPSLRDCDVFLEASIHFAKNSGFFDLVRENQSESHFSADRTINFGISLDISLEDDLASFQTRLIKARKEYPKSFCRIDLSSYTDEEIDFLDSWQNLILKLKALRKVNPNLGVVLSGFQFLWKVAQAQKKDLRSVFDEVLSLGVSLIESSSKEFEGALTSSETVALHREAHRSGLATTVKLELNARVDGKGFLWKVFLSKLNHYIVLQKETKGIKAFKLEPSPGAPMSMAEFLYAVTLTKYFLVSGGVESNLMVPLKSLPVLNSEACLFQEIQLKNSSVPSFVQKQFISLLALLGVQDIGAFDYTELSCRIEGAVSLGGNPSLCYLRERDAVFSVLDLRARKPSFERVSHVDIQLS